MCRWMHRTEAGRGRVGVRNPGLGISFEKVKKVGGGAGVG